MSKRQILAELEVVKKEQERIMSLSVDRVSQRTKLLYDLAFAIDILVTDIDESLTFTDAYGKPLRIGFKGEKKRWFNEFLSCIRRADTIYTNYLEGDLASAAEGDWKRELGFRQDCNELIRVVMLYIDRIRTEDDLKRYNELMESLPEGGIFPKDIVDRFKFKGR